MRTEWGCDAEVKGELDRVTCYACTPNDATCDRCKGARYLPLRRCPQAIRRQDIDSLVNLAIWALDAAALPATGGMLDQAAPFVQLVDVVGAERALCRKELDRGR